jgi:hypothetical protein
MGTLPELGRGHRANVGPTANPGGTVVAFSRRAGTRSLAVSPREFLGARALASVRSSSAEKAAETQHSFLRL